MEKIPSFSGVDLRRYCLTLKMRPEPDLIAEYVRRHGQVWAEVLAAQREAGVRNMEIYLSGATLFMIMEVDDGFSFERKAEIDRNNPTVMRWEGEMSRFQLADEGADASAKWQLMPRIFSLEDQLDA